MDKYYRTGCLSDPNQTMRPMTYGDFSDLGNYMDNMNKIVEAREMFEALPARVRERFANNPANMLDFVMDESNRDEAIKLGLLDVPEVPETVTAETAAEVGSTTEGNA
jgi:phage internal scaffolding protein